MSERLGEKERRYSDGPDVVIVGAGLSGLILHRDLQNRGVSSVILEANEDNQRKNAMYLVSQNTAKTWNLSDEYDSHKSRRPLISGLKVYTKTGQLIESITPDSTNKRGFAVLPQGKMEQSLKTTNNPCVFYGSEVDNVEERQDFVVVGTRKKSFNSRIVIDTTGWRSSIAERLHGSENHMIRALYGGNQRTFGHEPSELVFIKGLENNPGNWLMPIGANGSELVSGKNMPVTEAEDWWKKKSEKTYHEMISWLKTNLDINVNPNSSHTMAFRLQLAGKKMYQGRVFPFGEAAGLNSPYVGQLIDVLPVYSKILSEIIAQAKTNNTWNQVGLNMFNYIMEKPPFYYLVHSLLRQNSSDNPHTSPNRLIVKAMQNTFDNETLWRLMQENGLDLKSIRQMLIKSPIQILMFIIKTTPSLLQLARKEPHLFTQLIVSSRERLLKRLNLLNND